MKSNQIPDKPHLAALVFSRSSYTDSYGDSDYRDDVAYHAFDTEEELGKWLVDRQNNSYYRSYEAVRIIQVNPLTYSFEAKVSISK